MNALISLVSLRKSRIFGIFFLYRNIRIALVLRKDM